MDAFGPIDLLIRGPFLGVDHGRAKIRARSSSRRRKPTRKSVRGVSRLNSSIMSNVSLGPPCESPPPFEGDSRSPSPSPTIDLGSTITIVAAAPQLDDLVPRTGGLIGISTGRDKARLSQRSVVKRRPPKQLRQALRTAAVSNAVEKVVLAPEKPDPVQKQKGKSMTPPRAAPRARKAPQPQPRPRMTTGAAMKKKYANVKPRVDNGTSGSPRAAVCTSSKQRQRPAVAPKQYMKKQKIAPPVKRRTCTVQGKQPSVCDTLEAQREIAKSACVHAARVRRQATYKVGKTTAALPAKKMASNSTSLTRPSASRLATASWSEDERKKTGAIELQISAATLVDNLMKETLKRITLEETGVLSHCVDPVTKCNNNSDEAGNPTKEQGDTDTKAIPHLNERQSSDVISASTPSISVLTESTKRRSEMMQKAAALAQKEADRLIHLRQIQKSQQCMNPACNPKTGEAPPQNVTSACPEERKAAKAAIKERIKSLSSQRDELRSCSDKITPPKKMDGNAVVTDTHVNARKESSRSPRKDTHSSQKEAIRAPASTSVQATPVPTKVSKDSAPRAGVLRHRNSSDAIVPASKFTYATGCENVETPDVKISKARRVSSLARNFESIVQKTERVCAPKPAWKVELELARQRRNTRAKQDADATDESAEPVEEGIPAWKIEWDRKKAARMKQPEMSLRKRLVDVADSSVSDRIQRPPRGDQHGTVADRLQEISDTDVAMRIKTPEWKRVALNARMRNQQQEV